MSDDAPAPTKENMLELEARAEAAYAAMYEARSYEVKDLKDDALFYMARAGEIAVALGLADDAARLKMRAAHIMDVYNSQFRYVGR